MQNFARRYAPLAWQRCYRAVMPLHVRVYRSQRAVRAVRPLVRVRTADRSDPPLSHRAISDVQFPGSIASSYEPDPYVDYGRFLTPEGGVLFIYKDIDTRLRHILW